MINQYVHDRLPCGMEYGVLTLPQRRVVSFQLRVLAGLSAEPMDKLGLAGLVEDTIDKGTEKRTGPELSDAFDAIGAGVGSGTGRETMTFTCTVLPEHFEQAVALHAEFLRTPTFPQDVFEVSLELTRQEQDALEDHPSGLVDKYISRKAYGPVLGRHALGEPETIAGITRKDLVSYWRENFVAGRMIASVAGPIDARQASDILQKHFEGFGSSEQRGREPFPVQFTPETTHYPKELEQEQIGICWPGVDATHEAFPTQQVTLGILSGGMSGRLFTEVREQAGLGVLGQRVAGNAARGGHDLSGRLDDAATLRRNLRNTATRGGTACGRYRTGGTGTGHDRHCGSAGNGAATRRDLAALSWATISFSSVAPYRRRRRSPGIKAVTIGGIRDYLDAYPRDRLCVVTLGPRPLSMQASNRQNVEMSKR
jgi:hypothetical protein